MKSRPWHSPPRTGRSPNHLRRRRCLHPSPPARRVLGWTAAAAGLAAATALTVAVLTPNSTPNHVETGQSIAELGSITAIDHRDAQIAARVAEAQGFDRRLENQAAEIAQAQARGSDRRLENQAAEIAQARAHGSDRHLENLASGHSEGR